MGEIGMNVKLISYSQLSEKFLNDLISVIKEKGDITDGKVIALSAIRCCYSANKPTEIVTKEGAKYFGREATDGEGGTDADRLFRHVVRSGHTSTLEHLSFTFAIEGISRACLAQLTRHRVGFSFSVQSQRYVRFGSDDKTGGFNYVMPPSLTGSTAASFAFEKAMEDAQKRYDQLRSAGVPAEDARMVLPNAAATNLVMTANLRALLEFYSKRRKGRGAQWEIAELAERLREEVVTVEPWTERFFEEV